MNNSRIQAEASKLATSRTAYSLAREVLGLRAERDALKSNLERLKRASDDLLMNRDVDAADRLTRVLNHTPDQSLAFLVAEKQADVIDRLLHDDMRSGPGGDILPARMWKLANELRRQAEEGAA